MINQGRTGLLTLCSRTFHLQISTPTSSSYTMTQPPDGTVAPHMRQSCDPCHKQKLRCTRAGESHTGTCDRCHCRRTQCVYSSTLPKGRPGKYRPVDDRAKTDIDPANSGPTDTWPPVPTAPISPELHPQPETAGALGNVDSSTRLSINADMNVYQRLGNDPPTLTNNFFHGTQPRSHGLGSNP